MIEKKIYDDPHPRCTSFICLNECPNDCRDCQQYSCAYCARYDQELKKCKL
jgi:hypothetical protein